MRPSENKDLLALAFIVIGAVCFYVGGTVFDAAVHDNVDAITYLWLSSFAFAFGVIFGMLGLISLLTPQRVVDAMETEP